MEHRNYRIGLDIGITSVGWAVLENNSQDEPIRILDLGVRIFDAAEVPKTGDPLAAERRNARTTRRRLRRRRHRLDRIKYLFEKEGLIQIEDFMERYHSPNLPDVYKLRYEGLDRKLEDEEFAQVLLHIAKHRGFRSTRKAELKEGDNGKVLKATKENQERMKEKGYRTVGEMIYKDEAFHTDCEWAEHGYLLTPRNKADDYRHTMLRDLLEEEVKTLFVSQRAFGNEKATEGLEKDYLEIMLSQRSFDMGPGNQPDGAPSPYAMNGFEDTVGLCTFERESGERRAAKATYTAELFVALQKINHLKIVRMDGSSRNLTDEERELILDMLYTQKEVKYAAVRKKLNLEKEERFNTLNYYLKRGKEKEGTDNTVISEAEKAAEEDAIIKTTENVKFVSMTNCYEYRKRIGSYLETLPSEEKQTLLDRIGTVLTCYKNDDSRLQEFEKIGLDEELAESLLDLTPSKFQHLSLKAMKKILPYLRQGMTYDKACEAAGYDFKNDNCGEKSKLLKGEQIREIVEEITNPVVKRSVSQTIKVINAIIMEYGSPQAINIELAREMSRNFMDRKKLEKQMEENRKKNELAKKEIQELGFLNPKGQDILKYRLWHDQQHRCLYTGELIPLEKLFDGAYDIDHILPYSITFDDSYRNKALVTSQANREKGNRTPYEYFGNDEKRWKEYEARVNTFIRDYKKRQKLLKKGFTKEDRKEFKERNLNDTKYITRVIYNMIRQNLEMEPYSRPEKKKKVFAVNGSITAYLRKRWGFMQKDRSTDRHHAMDAAVVACCTDGMIQKISRSAQYREVLYKGRVKVDYEIVDVETGEIISLDELLREEWDERYGAQIPQPWPNFRDELDVRMGEDPKNFMDTHPDVYQLFRYPQDVYEKIRPIFVSRMPNHKVTGAAHADTIRSPRHYENGGNVFDEGGYVLSRTPITDLKLDKDGEVKDYYNKESDPLLYNALKRQLELFDNDGKKAFAEDFHKPKADGSKGPVVKKVKTYKKMSLGVAVNGGKGIAENGNGAMIRVDVFRENEKYYFVPVYTSDVVKKRLPNRAAVANKPYSEWKEMKDENFLFSLYSRDLVKFKHPKGKNVKCKDGTSITLIDEIVYYIGANIHTASFSCKAQDNKYEFDGLGIQSLKELKKYQVDVLGHVSEVKQEKRMGFH
ncbi:MAG: type II CRISPR RNA-guided endonuclease Cas9 [Lachnospiraceae bacterium]|nr:type II CRISPR RNA-guided endonuclease Cas9 [Lachnospiraceae bacterium]